MNTAPLSILQHKALSAASKCPLRRAADGHGGWLGDDGSRYTTRTTERLRMMGMLAYRDDTRSALVLAGAGRRALKAAA